MTLDMKGVRKNDRDTIQHDAIDASAGQVMCAEVTVCCAETSTAATSVAVVATSLSSAELFRAVPRICDRDAWEDFSAVQRALLAAVEPTWVDGFREYWYQLYILLLCTTDPAAFHRKT